MYAVDQLDNPDTVSLQKGGELSPSHLVAGQIGTVGGAEKSVSRTACSAMGQTAMGSQDQGSRTPSPFLPNDPYSPESVSGRQSDTREQEGRVRRIRTRQFQSVDRVKTWAGMTRAWLGMTREAEHLTKLVNGT